MNKYYFIAFLAILAIIILQISHISNLYANYKTEVSDDIGQALTIAIDEELHIRGVVFNEHKPAKEHNVVRIRMEDMTPAMLDSISKLPGAKDTINVTRAREEGAIGTSAEIMQQQKQGNFILRGDYIKMAVLDSIFNYRMQTNIPHRFILKDKDSQGIDSIGDFSFWKGNYATTKAIGLKGQQFLLLEADIPLSGFIRDEVLSMFANGLLMLFVIGCVAVQLGVIRRKEKVLQMREKATNGIIHDLKSPIATSISLLGLVRHRHKDEPEALAIAKNETMMNHLLHEIDTLADTVREGQTGAMLDYKPTNLYELAETVKQEIDMVYQQKQHTMNIFNELPDGKLVDVDADKVERILRNLVENAVKYADSGVEVNIRIFEQDGKPAISVVDNGWGIAPEHIKQIFKPYYRIEQPEGRYRKGLGMGLANVQQLVKAHGGVITVQSEIGKGSVFTFSLQQNE